jgi:hypothetical protein
LQKYDKQGEKIMSRWYDEDIKKLKDEFPDMNDDTKIERIASILGFPANKKKKVHIVGEMLSVTDDTMARGVVVPKIASEVNVPIAVTTGEEDPENRKLIGVLMPTTFVDEEGVERSPFEEERSVDPIIVKQIGSQPAMGQNTCLDVYSRVDKEVIATFISPELYREKFVPKGFLTLGDIQDFSGASKAKTKNGVGLSASSSDEERLDALIGSLKAAFDLASSGFDAEISITSEKGNKVVFTSSVKDISEMLEDDNTEIEEVTLTKKDEDKMRYMVMDAVNDAVDGVSTVFCIKARKNSKEVQIAVTFPKANSASGEERKLRF